MRKYIDLIKTKNFGPNISSSFDMMMSTALKDTRGVDIDVKRS